MGLNCVIFAMIITLEAVGPLNDKFWGSIRECSVTLMSILNLQQEQAIPSFSAGRAVSCWEC